MHDKDAGWGSVDFFTKNRKIHPDYLVIGVGNHDTSRSENCQHSQNITFSQLKNVDEAKTIF